MIKTIYKNLKINMALEFRMKDSHEEVRPNIKVVIKEVKNNQG